MDDLEFVIACLHACKGNLPAISQATGIPYDSLTRIRDRENDPGYSRVRHLADHFRNIKKTAAALTV